jgi:SMC interacting uncharacterized protein involved in chromosome segregation
LINIAKEAERVNSLFSPGKSLTDNVTQLVRKSHDCDNANESIVKSFPDDNFNLSLPITQNVSALIKKAKEGENVLGEIQKSLTFNVNIQDGVHMLTENTQEHEAMTNELSSFF